MQSKIIGSRKRIATRKQSESSKCARALGDKTAKQASPNLSSKIKPWGQFPNDRLNPQNGLCLSALHDAAFDAGLITLDENLRVVLSKRLRSFFPQPALEQNFVPFEGAPIRRPEKLAEPEAGFLRFHREEIFQS